MSHTSPDEFTEKLKTKKILWRWRIQGGNFLQDGNESVDISENSDTLRDDSIIKKTKEEEEALIQRLMNLNFKYHVIQSVIDIVSLCGKKW